MPQIANQDYNFIDFKELPFYEAVERLYRAYLNGTAFDCVVKQDNAVNKIFIYEEREVGDSEIVRFNPDTKGMRVYTIKAPLATDESGFLMFNSEVYIVSADGFKLKPVVQDEVLTGVQVTSGKVDQFDPAQYFKDWMIGQPVTQG